MSFRGMSFGARRIARSLAFGVIHAAGYSPGALYAAAGDPVTIGPPIVVTATRAPEVALRVPIGSRIISAQDIARSGASTLQDLLRTSPDLRTLDRSGSPNPQIDLRGFGGFGDQNTLMLLDGLRVRDYEQLTANWSAIPLESVERIEILPPGASVLYGGGATGGAINIVTRAPTPGSRAASAGATAGSLRTGAANAEVEAGGTNQ